ncbi:hypothetical protein M2325_001273 [Methanococcus voltae PS]|uniref:HNH endonuclease n=1 Tax=Methanococcus voltae PS TaxID=523842 RepID=A0ABT2EXC0_METVO|nr:ABC-three component system protein [Methanococcus voltae]MCS3922577.1 hypothetical protein [Methanococcus voltae PS]
MSRNISSKTMKLLFANSGNKCAICKTDITDKEDGNATVLGEMAHIEGLNPNSARYNTNMTDPERNSYDNLMILCPTCHAKIDHNEAKYTTYDLKKIKLDHEKWVSDRLIIKNFSFAHLDVILSFLINNSSVKTYNEEIRTITPGEKIAKNNLSSKIANFIKMGMCRTPDIKEYLNKNPDPNFSDVLRNIFVEKYLELKNKDISEDEIFIELITFASAGNIYDLSYYSAGISLVTYFFELCEVFEK